MIGEIKLACAQVLKKNPKYILLFVNIFHTIKIKSVVFFIISGRKKHTIVIYIRRNGMKVLKYIQNETQMNYLKMTEIL